MADRARPAAATVKRNFAGSKRLTPLFCGIALSVEPPVQQSGSPYLRARAMRPVVLDRVVVAVAGVSAITAFDAEIAEPIVIVKV